MEISVLAVKCRFCGESVGRPRDETRALTIDDLGGETIKHYAPSSSVMEAMEAFRSETEFKSNPPEDANAKRSVFGIGGRRKSKFDSNAPEKNSGLPELDERSQALASIALPSSTPAYARPALQQPTWIKKVGVFAGLVAAIIILWIGGGQVIAYINRPVDLVDRQFHNPAEKMLSSNADPISTLKEAMESLRKEEHPENRAVVEKARARVVDLIRAAQYPEQWTEDDLAKASRLVNQAFKIDSSLAELKEEIDADTFAYRMVLRNIQGDTATFQLSARAVEGNSGSNVTVKKGDTVQNRFEVVDIRGNSVQLRDTMREDRLLRYTVGANTSITSP
jgi:hypothetical protein